MNTKLLKQKILDLAIRGKLTQQLKSDGTARELLEQISSKVSSSSSTLSSPRRRGSPSSSAAKTIIPIDKSEAPFEIPANWEWVRIGDIFNLQAGKNIAAGLISSTCEDGYYPCFGGNGLRGFVSCFNREGDYPLIGRQGALCGNINRATGKFYATEHAVVVETNSMMNVSLACFFLTQLNLNQYASSTAQPGLSVAKINEVPIPLPPLAEQQRIVAKIEEAFAEIDSIENNKELLKTHIKQARQKILDLAIHGKLVPQNKADEPASVLLERITRDNPHYEKIEDGPFEIPQNWCWTKFGDCINVINGKNQSAVIDPEGHFPIYGSGGIMGRANSYLCPENCTIIGRKGSINNPIFVSEKFWNVDTAFGLCPSGIVLPKYLYFFCLWFDFSTLDNSTTLPSLTKTSIQQIPFVLAPLKEQSRIVAKVEELFSALDQMERNLV